MGHGVRKYENEVGVFTSIDPLWEQYRGWSPYHYAGNNPIMALDWNGKWITSNNSHLLVQDFE
jgi:RHS repeat-associated protein